MIRRCHHKSCKSIFLYLLEVTGKLLLINHISAVQFLGLAFCESLCSFARNYGWFKCKDFTPLSICLFQFYHTGSRRNLKTTLWLLFIDRVQLAQGWKVTVRRQFSFGLKVPRSSWDSFGKPWKNESLVWHWMYLLLLHSHYSREEVLIYNGICGGFISISHKKNDCYESRFSK